MTQTNPKVFYHASVFRRLAALVYDALIITALLFLATSVVMLVITITLGEESLIEHNILVENPLFFGWLLFCWYYYYAWCWRKGGQTLGMKAWRLKLVSCSGGTLSYGNALLRFSTAAMGLANLSVLLPVSVAGKRGWHDILSQTNVILIDKNS